jgi:hypothetical protein
MTSNQKLSTVSVLALSLGLGIADDPLTPRNELRSGSSPAQLTPATPGPAASQPAYNENRPLIVGVVLFDGFEPLDVFGPVGIFGSLGARAQIITLAETVRLAKPRFGPAVQVDCALAAVETLDLCIGACIGDWVLRLTKDPARS